MSEPTLSPVQLTDIFHDYSSEDIIEAKRSTEAFANEVYDITDSQGQCFFLKILKTQLPEVVATEVQMQQRLLAAGLQTPEYLEINPGSYVGNHNGADLFLANIFLGIRLRKLHKH